MANAGATIVVKKIKKVSGGHSGGAWKIAYADFVTAMMAFFLLLWLLNSVTQEALEGISNYFAPVSVAQSTSGSGGVLGGKVLSVEGAETSQSGQIAKTISMSPPRAGSGGETAEEVSERQAREKVEAVEQAEFEQAQEIISEALASSPELSELEDSLEVSRTTDGLRIQLLELEVFAMFQSGGTYLNEHARKMIALISKVILSMDQKLSISGHTDSVPFNRADGYSNWELSSDRANAVRRELLFNQVPEDRFTQVVGRAATEPMLPEDPTHASNRRLSIILLKGTGPMPKAGEQEEEAKAEDPSSFPSLDMSNGNAAMGQKKPEENYNSLEVKESGSFGSNLMQDDDEPGLPGLDQIKQKQLETSQ